MKINLGCGTKKLVGYVNVDSNKRVDPDLSFDITKNWPFESDSAEEILVDNTLEHIDGGLIDFIQESKRVLRPNGVLKIICPNCFFWKNRLRFLLGEFKANSGYHYDHRWFFKPSFLRNLLEDYGFEVSKVSDLMDVEVKIRARKRA